MKSPEDKTLPDQEINEDAIDAFLETEDVFPVDMKRYVDAVSEYSI